MWLGCLTGSMCMDVVDLCGADEASDETCLMDGNEKIWGVHVMIYADVDALYRVGCVCAGKRSGGDRPR
ncbi:hypothetical protein FG476_07980 [Xylella fastidiosa subsp. multiplex]|uniref:Uncharacterized protein n=4 Tax=Xylella fastidiosa TaxID=2371 RepID=A0A9Q4QSG4_XYLFS|nr:hypothetical protein [Xylella fastidiosa]AIC14066.1 hypothetical protein P303_10595 [Xylella fastidiosa MUL0034]ERI60630.1 hypothetical protein M233_03195 [Xylella fastidiosa subsp. multiplex Griffin-1]EWG14180.1 hypothetical protein P910_002589 [Xylella fastidiosa Mul-MD]KFA41731.1 hypothetical protein DF22_001728 [Xylella fastidiosa]MBE0268751.1 hypothetical protein [Xylella fastidiosa subsp. multiplex]